MDSLTWKIRETIEPNENNRSITIFNKLYPIYSRNKDEENTINKQQSRATAK